MDGRAGRDVDPARGLVAQQHAAAPEQPAAERHLLLIAAAQFANRLLDGAAAHVEAPDEVRRLAAARASASIHPARVATASRSRQRQVGADGERGDEPLLTSVLRQQSDPCADASMG